MKQYHDVLTEILDTGTWQKNRTNVESLMIPGAMMKFDMQKGFPAITTKKLHYQGVIGEMIGFLRGYTHADEFAKLGCNWWYKDANENTQWKASPYRTSPGDLGRIYGAQWRRWATTRGFIDQVDMALNTIRRDPTNRRIIISGWRPDEFQMMALPPCHVLYQFIVNVERNELNLCMYQRSCDMFLGVPMNIFGSALLLHLFAKATGLTPRHFTHFLADAHIYRNHIEQVGIQLGREALPLPTLVLHGMDHFANVNADGLAKIEPQQIELVNYQHHAAIKGEMVTG